MRLMGWIVGACAMVCFSATVMAGESVLSTLEKGHPRLMLNDEALMFLKAGFPEDPAMQKCWADVQADADRCLAKQPLVYNKVGPRLLHVSRDCLHRVYALALAYRWTGEERYAAKVRENLLEVCAFKDWNPSHFLDTAEMSNAVGVGYDWLYDYLNADDRRTIVAGLIENGLKPGLEAYDKGGGWTKIDHNWNQVCNGGLIVGALAIADIEPSYAERIVPAAIKSLPLALKTYGPDGAWGEGPGYWHYATRYTAYGLTALQTALGTTFGLLDIDGLSKAGYFPVHTTGPTGLYLNFADVGERRARGPMACMFWLARTFHNPLYAYAEHEIIAERAATAEHLVWYSACPPARAARKQRDKYFGGPVEVAVLRSAWDDPNALFVGIKAGYNQVNHGHLDLGNFELDALGVRWVRDLGADNYNLPGYWDKGRGGKRWSYYRLNSASHSVPMPDGRSQDPLAESSFAKVETNSDRPFAVVDLTEAYAEFAKSVRRGVTLVDRKALLVRDEFELKGPCDITWGITTDARISLRKEWIAELDLNGRMLQVRVQNPHHAAFSIESAEQEPPQRTNKGVKRLVLRLPQTEGNVAVEVLFSPVWPDGFVSSTGARPLAEW